MATHGKYAADEMNNLLSTTSSPGHKTGREVWLSPEPPRHTSWWRSFFQGEKKDVTSLSLWQACVAEYVGVFFLCFYTIGFGLADKKPGPELLQVALAVGFFIYVILSALSTVSGAHVNPAVTLAFLVTRQCSLVRSILYIVFQCAGAYSGTLVLRFVSYDEREGNLGLIVPPEKSTWIQVLVMEMMITGFLDFIIIAIVDSGRTDVKGSVPHCVGAAVTCNILLAAGISGACMNPARATGPAILMGNYTYLWIYWAGPCAGGVIGAFFYDKFFKVGVSVRNCFPCCREEDDVSREDSVDKERMAQVYS